MDGYLVYKLYIAVKNHFNIDSYDMFKYRFKTHSSRKSYNNRSDKRFFEILGDRVDSSKMALFLMIANFLHDNRFWIGDLASSEGLLIYNDWKGRVTYLNQNFETDLKNICRLCEKRGESIESILTSKKSQVPEIFTLMNSGKIMSETYIIFDKTFPFSHKYDTIDPYWHKINLMLKKYWIALSKYVSIENEKIMLRKAKRTLEEK